MLYEKIINLSPLTTKSLGSSTRLSRSFSTDAMRMVMDIYTVGLEPNRVDYIFNAITAIHSTYTQEEVSALVLAEKSKAKR